MSEILTKEEIIAYNENKELISPELLELLRKCGKSGKDIALQILDTPKDREQYYLDAYGNRISLFGNKRLKKVGTIMAFSQIHHEELAKCFNDIHYFVNNYVKIKTPKDGVNFPDMRKYQTDFLDFLMNDDNENIVGCIGRQAGKTITISMYFAWLYIFRSDLNLGIVAAKGSQTKEIINNIKNIILNLPMWMVPGVSVWNKSAIENEQKIRILTDVPSDNSFRGFTMNVILGDECAFIRQTIWKDFEDSIFPTQDALTWKKNILISTPNGMGNAFYRYVKGAQNGTNGYKLFTVDWRDVPRYDKKKKLVDPDVFRDKIIAKYGIVHFNQNYGCEFQGSSLTLIPSEQIDNFIVQKPIDVDEDKLNIFSYPKDGHTYTLTVDAAKDGEDGFAIQIFDTTSIRFKQVASANLQVNYLEMPEYVNSWGRLYNDALVIVENNEGAGQSVADQLYLHYQYPNLYFDIDSVTGKKKQYPGFRTSPKSRRLILQTFKLFSTSNNIDIVCEETIYQINRFILIGDKYQADEGEHDDLVMATALIFAPFMSVSNFEDIRNLKDQLYRNGGNNSDEQILTTSNSQLVDYTSVAKDKIRRFDSMFIGRFSNGGSSRSDYDW